MERTKTELTGEYMIAQAVQWREANPEAWDALVRMAKGYAKQGRRFSMERLFQTARYDMATNGHSQGFKVNNNTRAALARMMKAEHPELERYMETRKSKVDL